MEKNRVGVRKGAWTKDEDVLLRKCIEKYGEGKWHLVPLRAGLNRCRKSCRLRWLNYLRPNIKRGYFTKDEVDLIVRLHKLWSLIAGRLPGRTGNDVKNFWNTRIEKKPAAAGESCRGKTIQKTITESNIIRPRPRTFSKLQLPAWPVELTKPNEPNDGNPKNKKPSSTASSSKYWKTDDENPKNKQPSSSASLSQEEPNGWTSSNEKSKNKQPSPSVEEEVDECIRWWGNLLEITENVETPFSFSDEDHPIMEPILSPGFRDHENNYAGLSSLALDVDVWQLVSLEDK
ncbi:hypothetical protein Pfo_008504 [Paulownia fortunei]|nr:hypothetical protein Pfo_008504 [Paulownia fortunei]